MDNPQIWPSHTWPHVQRAITEHYLMLSRGGSISGRSTLARAEDESVFGYISCRCRLCDAAGILPNGDTCHRCKGTGFTSKKNPMSMAAGSIERKRCPRCKGSGKYYKHSAYNRQLKIWSRNKAYGQLRSPPGEPSPLANCLLCLGYTETEAGLIGPGKLKDVERGPGWVEVCSVLPTGLETRGFSAPDGPAGDQTVARMLSALATFDPEPALIVETLFGSIGSECEKRYRRREISIWPFSEAGRALLGLAAERAKRAKGQHAKLAAVASQAIESKDPVTLAHVRRAEEFAAAQIGRAKAALFRADRRSGGKVLDMARYRAAKS